MKKNDQRMQEAQDHVLEIVRRNDSVEIPIVLISFGTYFETTNSKGTLALPSEVGLVAFSIEDGVYDNFSSLIDPGIRRINHFLNLICTTENLTTYKICCRGNCE